MFKTLKSSFFLPALILVFVFPELVWPNSDTLRFKNGIYIGGLVAQKREGFGKMYFDNGDYYEGYWKKNEMHGRGKIQLVDGKKFLEEFLRQQADRERKSQVPFTFEGEFTGGSSRENFKGKGMAKWTDFGDYNGDFDNDGMNGFGKRNYTDGRSFEGSWFRGVAQVGKFFWPNGDWFHGDVSGAKINYEEMHRGFFRTVRFKSIFRDMGKMDTVFLSKSENVKVLRDKYHMHYGLIKNHGEWIRWDLSYSPANTLPSLSSGLVRIEAVQLDSGRRELVFFEKYKVSVRDDANYTRDIEGEDVLIWNVDSLCPVFGATVFLQEKICEYKYAKGFDPMKYLCVAEGFDCDCHCWKPCHGGPWRHAIKMKGRGFVRKRNILFRKGEVIFSNLQCWSFDNNFRLLNLCGKECFEDEIIRLKPNLYQCDWLTKCIVD
jgi:hypothetical protein